MASIPATTQIEKKESVPKFDAPDHPTAKSTEYPNDDVIYRGPSGTTIVAHTKNGQDAFSIVHASGSRFDFHPDGLVQMTSQNGQYHVVFGENRMLVTGAQDVTVQGGGSLRVEGDYNMTVKGNHTTTVDGAATLVAAKGVNMVTPEGFSVASKSTTLKATDGIEVAAGGVLTQSGKAGVATTSGKNIATFAKGDEIKFVQGETHVNNEDLPVTTA